MNEWNEIIAYNSIIVDSWLQSIERVLQPQLHLRIRITSRRVHVRITSAVLLRYVYAKVFLRSNAEINNTTTSTEIALYEAPSE